MLAALYEALVQDDHCAQLLIHTLSVPHGQRKEPRDVNRLQEAIVALSEDVVAELTARLTAIACLALLCSEEWNINSSTQAPPGRDAVILWYCAAKQNRSFELALETIIKACKVWSCVCTCAYNTKKHAPYKCSTPR